jgi:hypothetical protein
MSWMGVGETSSRKTVAVTSHALTARTNGRQKAPLASPPLGTPQVGGHSGGSAVVGGLGGLGAEPFL